MATIRERIVMLVVSKMQELYSIPTQSVFRSRLVPLTRDIIPAIVVQEREDTIGEEAPFGILDHALSLDIEVHVRGEAPTILADPIVDEVHKKLMVDTNISSLAVDTRLTGITFELQDADMAAGVVTMNYVIRYFTRFDNLSLIS